MREEKEKVETEEKEESEGKGIFGRGITDQIILLTIVLSLAGLAGSFKDTVINFYITDVLDLGLTFTAIRLSFQNVLIIFPIIFGTLSDNTRSRFGRRRPYFLLGGISGIAMFFFILRPSFILVLIIDLAFIGIPFAGFVAVRDVIIPDIIDVKIRGRVNGFISSVKSGVGLLPEVLYLVVYEYFSTTLPDQSRVFNPEAVIFLLILGGFFMIAASLLGFFFIKEPKLSEMPPKKNVIDAVKSTFYTKEIRQHRDYFFFTIGFLIYNLASLMIGIYLMFYIRALGVPAVLLVVAILFLGPIGVGLVYLGGFAADKYGRKPLIIPLLILGSIGGVLMAFAGTGDSINFVLLVVGILFTLQGTATIDMPLLAWRQDLLDDEKRGQYNGFFLLLRSITSIPALFVITMIADSYGIQFMFLTAPIFYVLSIPFFLKVKETLNTEESNIIITDLTNKDIKMES